jgi:D-proline reductase (dithiol) PrdB
VGLVTTAGVHLRSQSPFDMEDPDGDPSLRVFSTETAPADLVITHKYYDHSAADRDINVVLPLDRLRELAAEGVIRGVGPRCYGLMGHIDGRHLDTLIRETAPTVARALRADGVDAAFLTPA